MIKNYTIATFIVTGSILLIGASCTMQKPRLNEQNNIYPDASNQTEIKTFKIEAFNFGYSQTEINVKKGDQVKIILTSTDGFHDLVIDELNVATAKINTGKTAEISFTADQVGNFEYYCSIGNHRQAGMVGKIIVEE